MKLYFRLMLLLFFFSSIWPQWKEVKGASTPKFNIKDKVTIGNKNNIWTLGLEDTPYQWTGNDWVHRGPIKEINSISASSDGSVYALMRKNYDAKTKNQLNQLGFRKLNEQMQAGEFIPDYTQPMYQWKDNKWQKVFDFKEIGNAREIATIKNNSVIIIIDNKVFHWNGSSLEPMNTIDGFISISAGSDGTVWGITQAQIQDTIKISILRWNDNKWELIHQYDRSPVEQFIPDRLAIIDKDTILLANGNTLTTMKISKWNLKTNQFEPLDNKEGFTFVTAGQDTIWAPNWDNVIYQWTGKIKN